jgi:hypothetical protein
MKDLRDKLVLVTGSGEAVASTGREAVMARTLKRWAPSLPERVVRG